MTTMDKELKFAPREIFEQILEWSVIPTFDLVVEYGDEGVVIVRRKISPYKGMWALPGLRMFKPESIEDTIARVALSELGLHVDPTQRRFLGQYVGRFRTERQRQDVSTGYVVRADSSEELRHNPAHFSSARVVNEVPDGLGAMYKFYLERYFAGASADN
jgi:ADP-ribose pyrophosphatase YjhB (NUDIX family)